VPGVAAKYETAANCAAVIDSGWNGISRDAVDMEYLARRSMRGQDVLAANTTRLSIEPTLNPPVRLPQALGMTEGRAGVPSRFGPSLTHQTARLPGSACGHR
jgi:hypothetical protein